MQDRPGNTDAEPPRADHEPEIVRRIEQALRDAEALYGRLHTPRQRGRAVLSAKYLLEGMQRAEHNREPFFGTLEE